MAWTDERIEKLKTLWADGLSASQIATALGGVTRNAVIGKIHRLGLSARTKGAAAPPRQPRPRPARREQPTVARAALAAPQPQLKSPVTIGNSALEAAPVMTVVPVVAPSAEILSLHGGVTFAEIGPCMCRWPIGDPSEEGFRLCGRPSPAGQPYCPEHSARAFHTRSDRPRSTG